MRTPTGRHFRESPHATTDIEHQFASKVFWPKPGTPSKISFRSLAAGVIELGSRVKLPLKTEAPGIVLRIDETKHSVQQRVLSPAVKAH
jgi:hypothetical protein